ncbi:polysaccharide biosynthesis tyrosine autokinase [Paraconexibacter antarcticus]|uniref:Polysaccharide biosynthesis tyrosine autokinase n=1 Tax=Paraconexibacter antarcticus TaxID=2949664 RepID=A0ABY5DNG6_9ACTN|nr:polysaccharide biosynthesis tyrosine autokinase [Paraconexibacter antarcticus]UTI62617.1 polysaccharide biosynthesis tyrosine autokinase [Paraconexibacter antarcticus]
MTTEPQETTIGDYVRVLRQRRLLIAFVAIACAAVAFGVSALQTPNYKATASLEVKDVNSELSVLGGGFLSGQTPLQLASAHVAQVTRPEVVARVKRQLKSRLTPSALENKVSVSIDPNSFLVKVTATTRHARDAAEVANAFAEADARLSTRETRAGFTSAAAKLNRKLKQLNSAKDANTRAIYISQLSRLQSLSAVAEPIAVSDQAQIPGSPSSPRPVRNTLAALIFGFLLGVALAFARAAFDRRLRAASDVTAELDYPVVGQIRSQALGHAGSVNVPGPKRKTLGPLTDADEESFRILRHNVRYLAADEEMRTILVTSAMAQEGKSTVSSCLAMASAAAGKRTLLVECDLRRPVLAGRFGLSDGPGLSDYLTGNAEPSEIIRIVQTDEADGGAPVGPGAEPLVCITAGSSPPRPADLLGSERFRAFLQEVSSVYDTVIVDTAPLLTVADTLEIVPHVSCVLLCVRLQQSTRDQANAAREALGRLPARPTGLVLTDVKDTGEGYYGYYAADTSRVQA